VFSIADGSALLWSTSDRSHFTLLRRGPAHCFPVSAPRQFSRCNSATARRWLRCSAASSHQASSPPRPACWRGGCQWKGRGLHKYHPSTELQLQRRGAPITAHVHLLISLRACAAHLPACPLACLHPTPPDAQVNAPGTMVNTDNNSTTVKAPYTTVETTPGGTTVQVRRCARQALCSVVWLAV
jgi:hypothetical protein